MPAIAHWLGIGGGEGGQGSDPGASRHPGPPKETGIPFELGCTAVAYEPTVGFTQIAAREGA